MTGPASPLVGMAAAARARGVSYRQFAARWRDYVRRGFPAPVEDARPYLWRRQSLQDWAERAEAATRAALLAPPSAANDSRRHERLDHQRARLGLLQRGPHARDGL